MNTRKKGESLNCGRIVIRYKIKIVDIMKEKFKTENVENKAQNAFIAFLGLLLFRKR